MWSTENALPEPLGVEEEGILEVDEEEGEDEAALGEEEEACDVVAVVVDVAPIPLRASLPLLVSRSLPCSSLPVRTASCAACSCAPCTRCPWVCSGHTSSGPARIRPSSGCV